jgi:hypothetical protein
VLGGARAGRLGRQALNLGTRLLLRNTQVIGGLKIEPELRTCGEQVPEAECRITCD